MEEDEGADRPAESHHGNEDLPGSNPTGFPEDGRDEQSDDRAPEGECRSHRSEDSLDLPRADSLDPIRPAIDIHSCELDDLLLRHRHPRIIAPRGRRNCHVFVTSSSGSVTGARHAKRSQT